MWAGVAAHPQVREWAPRCPVLDVLMELQDLSPLLEELRVVTLLPEAVPLRVCRQREPELLALHRPEPLWLQSRSLPLETEVLDECVLLRRAETFEAAQSSVTE